MTTAKWFKAEIASGLELLRALALPGSPAADTIGKTAEAWCLSLGGVNAWDEELDTWRLRAAFLRLSRSAERWPAPVRLLQCLPARKERVALGPAKLTPEQKARASEIVAKLRAMVAKRKSA